MEAHELKYPKGKEAVDDFMEASKMRKSKNMPKKSPYTVTIWMQISACIIRAYQRMWGDKSTLVSTLMSNLIMSLVIGSVFYNIPENTSGFFSKVTIPIGVLLIIGWCYVFWYFIQCFPGFGRDQSDVRAEADYCNPRTYQGANK